MSALWININRNGGLGNRLFARAHVYAAAKEFGATVVDWGLSDWARHFPAAVSAGLPCYPPSEAASTGLPGRWWLSGRVLGALRCLRPRRTGRHGPVWSCYWGGADPDTMALDGAAFREFAGARRILVLDGYKLRCTPWVRKHADEICRYFAPARVLQAKWTALQAQWHARWPVTIAVHMRATDFRNAQGGRYYLTPTEYASLLRTSPAIDPARTLFVLFSDENFRRNAEFEALQAAFAGLDHVFMHGDVMDDLVGIASCDRIVGPMSSTFSRWASFSADRAWSGVARRMLDRGAPPLAFRRGLVPWDYGAGAQPDS